jgi:CubicO group peptidase (beta-lactamase class C family)
MSSSERFQRVLCLSFTLFAITVAHEAEAQSRAQRIDSIVRAAFDSGAFHGGILVADGDEVIYRNAYGKADIPAGTPNRPETLTPIGSITKPFTAILALQLVQEGKLDLNGTLKQYLPSFSAPAADRITLHHLLSHTSGIPDYIFAIPGYMSSEPPNLSRDSVLSIIQGLPLEFEPGEGFAYSNTGYVLVGRIIELVTGNPYAQVLEERIFARLGMRSTHWMAIESGPTMARQYMPAFAGEAPEVEIFPGEAGIVTTLDDMLRFGRAIGSAALLSPRMWELAFTAHAQPESATRPHPGTRFPHGYGFSLAEDPDGSGATVRRVSHGGIGYGGSAMFQHFPDRGWTIVFWNNVGGLRPQIPGLVEALAADGR